MDRSWGRRKPCSQEAASWCNCREHPGVRKGWFGGVVGVTVSPLLDPVSALRAASRRGGPGQTRLTPRAHRRCPLATGPGE